MGKTDLPQAGSSVYALCCLFLFLNWEMTSATLAAGHKVFGSRIELSVGTVHVASFAFQTLVVTNE